MDRVTTTGDGSSRPLSAQVTALLTAPPAGPFTAELAKSIDHIEGSLETDVGTVEISRYKANRDVYILKVTNPKDASSCTFLMNRNGQFLCIDGEASCTFEQLSKEVGYASAKETRELYMERLSDPWEHEELPLGKRPAFAALVESGAISGTLEAADFTTVTDFLNSAVLDPALMRAYLHHQQVDAGALALSEKYELVLKAKNVTFSGFDPSEVKQVLTDPSLLVEIAVAMDIGMARGTFNKEWTKIHFELYHD